MGGHNRTAPVGTPTLDELAVAPPGAPAAATDMRSLGAPQLLALQQAAGNRVARRAAEGEGAEVVRRSPEDVIRRRGGGGKKKRTGAQKRKNRNARAQQQPTQTPAPAPATKGWGEWASGLASSAMSWVPGLGTTSVGRDGDHATGEREFGTQEPEDESTFLESLLPEKVEITLIELEGEERSKDLGRGVTAKGRGEAALKGGLDGFEGSGKVELSLGRGHTFGEYDGSLMGGVLQGHGEAEGFVGATAELEGEAGYERESGDMALKGKVSALIGASAEGSAEVRIVSDGKDLGTVKATVGVTVGVGGELKAWVTWKGGVLDMACGGKWAAGVGVSWEYGLTVDTVELAKQGAGWLAALWEWAGSDEAQDLWL